MRQGGADIDHTQALEGLVVTEGLVEILGGVAQFDARCLAPVEVGHQHAVAFLGQLVGHGSHGGIDAEDLLVQDDARATTVGGGYEVGSEGAGGGRHLNEGSGHRERLQVAQVWSHLPREEPGELSADCRDHPLDAANSAGQVARYGSPLGAARLPPPPGLGHSETSLAPRQEPS